MFATKLGISFTFHIWKVQVVGLSKQSFSCCKHTIHSTFLTFCNLLYSKPLPTTKSHGQPTQQLSVRNKKSLYTQKLFLCSGITTEYIEVQDFVCEVASCLYKHCLFLTDNQPEIQSTNHESIIDYYGQINRASMPYLCIKNKGLDLVLSQIRIIINM